jgi:hypothetical protein
MNAIVAQRPTTHYFRVMQPGMIVIIGRVACVAAYMVYLADYAGVQQFASLEHRRVEPIVEPCRQEHLIFPRRGDHGTALVWRTGKRFFTEDVFPRAARSNCHLCVKRGRSGYDDCINIVTVNQPSPVFLNSSTCGHR